MSPLDRSAAACDYCGLPLAVQSVSPEASAVGPTDDLPRYCCFGCRFSAAIAGDSKNDEATGTAGSGALMARLGLAVFLAMNVMVATMFLWSQGSTGESRLSTAAYDLFRYIGLLFTTPVLFLLGGPLLQDAWSELRDRRLSTSLLLCLGVAAAYAFSVDSVIRGGPVYFEIVCMVLVAVTLGRYLEAQGKLRTTRALRSLQQLLPERVRLVQDAGESLVPLGQIAAGDRLRVLAGERIPVDGVVELHRAAVDEQLVTGESVPVEKGPGDRVQSGTLDLDGQIVIRATAAAGQGTLETLVSLVLEAASRKGPYQKLADRVSAWFLPLVLAIAVVSFAVHWRWGNPSSALFAALSVVVIACPCALGLATPMAVWAALGRATRGQVLFRDGEVLSRLGAAHIVCLDKTGTLTTGSPVVESVLVASESSPEQDRALAVAASLAMASVHPLSQAIVVHAGHQPPGAHLPASALASDDVRVLPGRGVAGKVRGISEFVYLGSRALIDEQNLAWPDALAEQLRLRVSDSHSVCYLGFAGRVQAAIVFREQLRSEAGMALRMLREQGMRIVLLTGDRPERAAAIAGQLGIEAQGGLSPQQKLDAVERLRGLRGGVVMVGDGVNDAPALSAADVGVALGCGADVSRFTAGVCLLSSDLGRLPWAIALARRTVRTIRWNLLWAFGYNAAGIAVAAAGRLNPILAALAMVVSSLLVVSNSLRLAEGGETTGDESAERRRASGIATENTPGEPPAADRPETGGHEAEAALAGGTAR